MDHTLSATEHGQKDAEDASFWHEQPTDDELLLTVARYYFISLAARRDLPAYLDGNSHWHAYRDEYLAAFALATG